MPTRGSISKRGKGPIRAEAGPDVTANHAPIQISRGAGVTLVEQALESRFIDEKPKRLIGDRAYDSDPLDAELTCQGIEIIAPHRRRRRKPK